MANHSYFGLLSSLVAVCLWINGAEAAPLQNGQLSRAVRDVRVSQPDGTLVSASANAVLSDGLVETGSDSRAEITFRDQSVVRLGDQTTFGFESRSRTFELTSGAVLTQVPAGVGGTKLKVRGITATATGTTLAVECLPQAYTKFIVLDGTSRLCLNNKGWANDCVLLRAGQMLIAGPEPKALPESVDVDLTRLLQTCQFITEFRKLPGQDRLVKAASRQSRRKSHGSYADTDLVIFGRGTLVSVTKPKPTPANTSASSATASPAPKQESLARR